MLIVGTDNTKILDHLPSSFLLIDDGPMIDALTFKRRRITKFDHKTHSLNPLKGMDYKRARDFMALINSIFPEGESTLTRKNSNFVLLNALLAKPGTLDTLLEPSKDPAAQDAYQKIQTLLLSPVLNRVLLRPQNFSLKGIVLARLNRAELGDFDCFVLGNLLISQYQGHVVVPDYGFYACPFHTGLIRQVRLTAGVNYLDELPDTIKSLMLLGELLPSRALYDDAEALALHAGLSKGTVAFSDFVQRAIRS